MSDNIPFDIQVEIIKRLPVGRSLIQFQSVSKAWKSQIDSSDFIARYQTQMQHILVAYNKPRDVNTNYISIADYHTFPHQKVSPTVPLLVNMLTHSRIIGSSHGLLCLHGVYRKNHGNSISEKDVAVLWNPSIRRAIAVVVPNVLHGVYGTVFGFGVCRSTTDPKILKITHINRQVEVEVVTLSTGVWRRPYSSNPPRKSITFDWCSHVVADGFLYWLAKDSGIIMGGEYTSDNLIMSFDITTEEFREVNLPYRLACESYYALSMSKLRESVVVLQRGAEAHNPATFVWMMEHGVRKSFTKLFTISVDITYARVRSLRKNGEPILEISKDHFPLCSLFVYDPNSKHFDYLGIDELAGTFFVYPYMETLLLLDQPNVAAYNEREAIRFLNDLTSYRQQRCTIKNLLKIYTS